MSLCINPHCPNPNHPGNARQHHCQSCHADLTIHKRYRVVRLLSDSTGFGKIYEARDRGQPKILKILKIDDPKAIALFQQEAEVLGQLNHPGIPKIDTYFTWRPQRSAKPLHCLVMEKIYGQNLQTWMKGKSPIPYEQALDWLQQLVEILNCVHQRQYFHRDIKPANIMRRPDGRLTLIDFGTAREMTHTYLAKMGGGSGVTSIASAGYTPLEQNNGKAVPQSDFYALGRTFVFLLTGKNPTAFDEDPRTGQLIWHEGLSELPQAFVDLIDRMMAPFPGNRPPNTEAIAMQLQGLATEAQKPKPQQNPVIGPAQTAATVPLFLQKVQKSVSTNNESISLNTPSIQLDISLPSATRILSQTWQKIPAWGWKIGGGIAIAWIGFNGAMSWRQSQPPEQSLLTLNRGLSDFTFALPKEPLTQALPIPTPPPVAEPILLNLNTQNNGVSLRVSALRKEQNHYVLDITLQNSTARSLEFLSSFFKLTDDRGMTMSVIVEDLPEILPGNNQSASGKLIISPGLLIGSQSITLTVTDTEERVQLTIPNIPLTAGVQNLSDEMSRSDPLAPRPSEANTPRPSLSPREDNGFRSENTL
ncbi:MAG: serine/threonine protein kinase [Spirulinaceae cyanobacterium]